VAQNFLLAATAKLPSGARTPGEIHKIPTGNEVPCFCKDRMRCVQEIYFSVLNKPWQAMASMPNLEQCRGLCKQAREKPMGASIRAAHQPAGRNWAGYKQVKGCAPIRGIRIISSCLSSSEILNQGVEPLERSPVQSNHDNKILFIVIIGLV
jgi:hypothetical protein